MFPSIQDLTSQFIAEFSGPQLDTPYQVSGIADPVLVRHARKSADDYSEEERERYPVISIIDSYPEFSELNNNDVFNYKVIGDESQDATYNGETVPHKPVFSRSFFMLFPFDVHFASLNRAELLNARNHFLTKFGYRGVFIFNGYRDYKLIADQDRILERVEYEVTRTEADRNDGINHDIYQFKLNAWISSGDPELLPLLKSLNIDLKPKSL